MYQRNVTQVQLATGNCFAPRQFVDVDRNTN